jgi:hypothetical protein
VSNPGWHVTHTEVVVHRSDTRRYGSAAAVLVGQPHQLWVGGLRNRHLVEPAEISVFTVSRRDAMCPARSVSLRPRCLAPSMQFRHVLAHSLAQRGLRPQLARRRYGY